MGQSLYILKIQNDHGVDAQPEAASTIQPFSKHWAVVHNRDQAVDQVSSRIVVFGTLYNLDGVSQVLKCIFNGARRYESPKNLERIFSHLRVAHEGKDDSAALARPEERGVVRMVVQQSDEAGKYCVAGGGVANDALVLKGVRLCLMISSGV